MFSKRAMIEFFEKSYASEQDDFEACDMDLDPAFEEKEKNCDLGTNEETVLANPLVRFLFNIISFLNTSDNSCSHR